MSLQNELDCAKKAAVEAGQAIAKYYGQSLDITMKDVDQPLTKADLAANQIIRKHLKDGFPQYGWLSEEDVDNVERLSKEFLWVVDPLDGTKDFINQNPEFAVSIALVRNKVPVLGVVYNPITKELFWGVKGEGAFCDGKSIGVSKERKLDKTHLLVSVSEHKRGEWEQFEDKFEVTPTGGCAYKMSKIARGDADGTFTLSPKSEWDICAGHVVIEEAGGKVTYLNGKDLNYNNESTLLDGLIYTSGETIHSEILDTIKGL